MLIDAKILISKLYALEMILKSNIDTLICQLFQGMYFISRNAVESN